MRRRFFQTHKNNVENLTLVSLEDNNEIYLNAGAPGIIGEIEMKVSGDYKWMPNGAVILNKGDFIEYRGTISNISEGQGRIGTFVISKKVNLYGDCTSILKDRMLFSNSLAYLFENTPVVNIHSTFLPATTLADCCYDSMFYGCTSLTTAPELPATTLADCCYDSMFYGCTSLTTAPELPATTLAYRCYKSMFSGCTNLTTAPALPATTLANYCYQYMFSGCTSLTAAPALPATTLTNWCYNNMFYGCTSLTTAPELPATTLASGCYERMFYNCINLNYIKMLATDISATKCLYYWVRNVASTGTFVKNPDMTTLSTGENGIPSGWTVVNNGEESGGGLA